MEIWIANYEFKTSFGTRIIPDVVTLRLPQHHIMRQSDATVRALRGIGITDLKSFEKDEKLIIKTKQICIAQKQ